MSQGLPLVLSKIDIFEEIAGDAGLYFDNSNKEEFAAQVLQLEDESVWLRQSKRGIARSKDFSWAESAKKLHELLSSLS
jgi:glycosyltransferase involved in cell wall biosynthesis